MRLTNRFGSTIWWRTFSASDTVYGFGHRDATLADGSTVTIDHPHGQFQLEIKRGGLGFPHIVFPSRIFSNGDTEFILGSDGSLVEVQPHFVELVPTSTAQVPYGRSYEFTDLLGASSAVPRTIKTAVAIAHTRSRSIADENAIKNSTKVSAGFKVDAKLKATDGVEFGPSASVTAEAQQELSNKLSQTYGDTFSQSLTAEQSFQVNAPAGKITVLVLHWTRQIQRGILNYRGVAYDFVATIGFSASPSIAEYTSVQAMPPDVQEAFQELQQQPTMWSISAVAAAGGRRPRRFSGGVWQDIPGGLTEISVSSDGSVWGLNEASNIFEQDGTGWSARPGAARDIGVGRNGSAWVIGTNPVAGGFGIFSWNGANWEGVSGGAARISVSHEGTPWIVNDTGQIFRRLGANWIVLPGRAHDIAVGSGQNAWVIGINSVAGGFGIYRWNGSDWDGIPGGAVRIAFDPQEIPWVLNDGGALFRFNGTDWTMMPGEASAI